MLDWHPLLIVALIAALAMTGTWSLQRRTRNTGFVDVWNAVDHLKQVLESGEWQRPEFNRKHAVTCGRRP